MNNLLLRIGQIGHDENLPEFIQKRVKLSNHLAFAIVLLVIPMFGGALITGDKSLIYKVLPAVMIGLCLLTPVLNALKLQYLSRLLLALIPTTLIAILHGFTLNAGSPPVAGLFVLQAGFALLALALFDLREWPWLLTLGFVHYMSFLSFDNVNALFEITDHIPTVRHGVMEKIAVLAGLSIAFGTGYMLLKLNKASESRSKELADEVSKCREAIKTSETELKDYIEKTKSAQEQEKLRIWESEGIAKFGETLRVYDGEDDIYDKLTSELVKYLEVNQGGFYLVQEEDDKKYLELMGCYAYQRKKFLHQKIAPGEGLVGQTYLEKLPTFITEVPGEFINITSGLGDAPPTCIAIMPLIHNDIVEGVIELASFKPIDQYKIEFLEKLGTNIASWASSDRINKRTRRLYEDSQLQAQQMREQEEEMRQNLEELAATQEDMKRKEDELKKLLAKSQDQFIQQSLQEIKLQINNDLEGARRELSFLSNVPPISGILRALDHDMLDPEDNSSYEVWINRLVTILEALLIYKKIYHGIHLYENKAHHLLSVINDGEGMKILKQGKGTAADHQIISQIKNYEVSEIFVNEPESTDQNGFIIKLGIPIYFNDEQRGGLIIDLLGEVMINKIQSKEDRENAFRLSNSLNHTIYEKQGSSGAFKESALSEQIIINEKQDFRLMISHLESALN